MNVCLSLFIALNSIIFELATAIGLTAYIAACKNTHSVTIIAPYAVLNINFLYLIEMNFIYHNVVLKYCVNQERGVCYLIFVYFEMLK